MDFSKQLSLVIENNREVILSHALKVVLAIIVLIIGLKISSYFAKKVEALLQNKNIDVSLSRFLASVTGWILKIAVVLTTVRTLGFEVTSFVAILGSAGLAIGLALQGSLSNFAGGVVILILKPFKVGDFITAQGVSGTVESISTFATTLTTGDNKTIIVPNGSLANSTITNNSTKDTRRVDMVFGIGYSDDLKAAKDIIQKHFDSDERVLKDPSYLIVLGELAESSVNIYARAWTKSSDYWGFYYATLEKIKADFDAANISFPFPQRDITIVKE